MLNYTPSVQRLKKRNWLYEPTKRPEKCIDMTPYEEYTRILNAMDALKQRLKKEPTSTAISNNFDGTEHKSSSSIAQK